MSTSSPEAIAAYPMSDQWDIRAFANQQAFDRGRSLHLAATREALVAELNRHEWQMLRNDDHEDTGGIRCMCGEWSSAKIGLYRPHAEFYNHRIDAILAPGGPIQLASDVQAAAWDACQIRLMHLS